MANMQPANAAEEERMLRAAMAASRQGAAAAVNPRESQESVAQQLARERGLPQASGGDGGDGAACHPACLMGVCLVTLVAVFSLILASMAVVDPTQYGLRFDRFFMTVDEKAKQAGRHWIGPLSHMIIYPSTVQTIEFSSRSVATDAPLTTRTDEGLDLTVHVGFQYKLKPESLRDLYINYKDDYKTVFTRQATSLLLQVAGTYEAEKYWTERPEIGEAMLLGLQNLFASAAEITGLQLFVISLPDSFETKIVETQVQTQIRRTRENEKLASVTRAEIQVMLADFSRAGQIALNNASATAYFMRRYATAYAEQKRINVEHEAIAGVASKLELSPAGLVEYQRGMAYQSLGSAQFMFGVPNAAAIVDVAGR